MAETALVLEDSAVQLRIVSTMMTQLGWTVVPARSISSALRLLRTMRVDLVLTDVFVDRVNALVHIDALRAAAGPAPIAAMSAGGNGYTVEETLRLARMARVPYVLQKPFTKAALEELLTGVLDKRPAPAPVYDDLDVVEI